MKILFINESQGENIGDQAIYCGAQHLLENETNHSISQLQLSLLPIKSIKTIKKSNKESWFFKVCKSNSYIYELILILRLILFNLKRLPKVFRMVRSSDLIIFGGGSLLIDNKCVFPINIYILSKVCLILNKPYGFAGVSTRDIKRKVPQQILKNAVKKSKFMYFRDNESVDICSRQFKKQGKFIPDFALCLNSDIDHQYKNNLAINVMGKQKHGYFSCDEKYNKYLTSLSKLISNASSSYNITLFTTGEKSDEEAVHTLNELLNKKFNLTVKYQFPKSISDLGLFYKSNNIIFATRLHSAIIGLAYGCQVTCFNWDSKVSGFFNTLKISSALVENDDDFFDKLKDARLLKLVTKDHYSDFITEVTKYEK